MKATHPAIIIATVPRSGSSYLTSLITSTLGSRFREASALWTSDLVLALRTSKTGIWGIKIFAWHRQHMVDTWPPTIVPFKESRFIHLFREDCIASAVSMEKVNQSHRWENCTHLTYPPDTTTYQYRARHIENIAKRFYLAQHSWKFYFNTHGITPLTLTYRDLFANTEGVFKDICRLLEVPQIPYVDPAHAKLGDALNEEWISRFKAEHPALNLQLSFNT